ncbi:MAG: enzyme of heme biosynthesis [Rikenellaceae bacterium]
MKKTFTLLVLSLFSACVCAFAQTPSVDFNSPQYAMWGADAEEREANMFLSTFMREAFNNKQYDEAAGLFCQLIEKCPGASDAIYARALQIYKTKISRATNLKEKKVLVDSLIMIHNLRLQYFANHAERGAAYITDAKARDFYNYAKSDREGLRDAFKQMIEHNMAKIDLELVLLYYRGVCDDYGMDLVMADEVISEYDRLSPLFEGNEEQTAAFNSAFGASGVATCENLEEIFKPRIAASPDNRRMLSQVVRLMSRVGCRSPFYKALAERQYNNEPSSRSAMILASIFQADGDYEKASKYLRDALATETNMEEKEALYTRIALVEYAASNMDAAYKAAKAALDTPDNTDADNGIAMFIIAQCYAADAPSCVNELKGRVAYWAAADMMTRALSRFTTEEESYREPAKSMRVTYMENFPSAEDCFFEELEKGSDYVIKSGLAAGHTTRVRTRD